MKVGFYSPLPPAKSGVADYAAALLPELQKLGDVEVNARSCDIGLYQLGNNQLHREIYERALQKPGVVVLHDSVLQHFFLGSLSEEDYVAEFVYNYGEWTRSEARIMWSERASSGMDGRYFSRPMLKRIAEKSLAMIVHNPAAADIVREHASGARVFEIPHFFADCKPADAASALTIRSMAGYLFGVFGYLREAKRLIPTLKAFERLQRARPNAGLIVAGEMHSSDLAKAVEPWLGIPGVRRVGFMRKQQFEIVCAAVDCCINLRYPGAGETSGIGVRLMGLGKPVIVTAGREYASLPDTAYMAVEPGASEQEHLFQAMALLTEFPEVGRAMGRRASEHIVRYHSLTRAAQQYWNVLCDCFHSSSR